MPSLWERQTTGTVEEPAKAFHAFTLYRDDGAKRSLEKVAAALRAARLGQNGGNKAVSVPGGRRVPRYIEDWSKTWKWVERVRAFDAEQDRLKREAYGKEIEEMGRRQAQQAMGASQILSLPIIATVNKLKKLGNSLEELEHLSLDNLLKMSVSSAMFLGQMHRAERDARGVDPRHLGPAGGFSDRSKGSDGQSAAAAPVTIAGAEFAWVQGRCTCGHTHSVHDQSHEDPTKVPCTVPDCKCVKYRDADDAEQGGEDD